MKNPLIIIIGPTAVGKSSVGVELAAKINAEIISGDSMQIYKGMDIGTAKIKIKDQFASNGFFIPHHLVDILEPDQPFSVSDFQLLARRLIKSIQKRGKKPLIVGGTGLYIQSIIDKYIFMPQHDELLIKIRKDLQQKLAEKGNLALYDELQKTDPIAAEKIHINDAKRIIRALETFHLTGHRLSDNWLLKSPGYQSEYNPLSIIGLTMSRDELYQRINARVDQMITDGLVGEVHELLVKGYHENFKSMQSIGYKEICSYLKGEYSLENAISQIKMATRRFAKRQLTWFLKDKRIKWFNVLNYRSVPEIVSEIDQHLGGQHPTM